jgi:hypothetical protein
MFDRFGPVAFGVVLLLAIWHQIVQPELDAARADRREYAAVLVTVSENMRESARLFHAAAELAASTMTREGSR